MKRVHIILLILFIMTTVLIAVPRNKVVVEIGTGTWCQFCPGAAMGADDLIANNHPVAIIENHNGDAYANDFSNARNTYYGITGYPTAFFDGGNPSVGGSNTVSMYNNYLPKVNARLAIPSRYTINAGGGSSGNIFNLNVTIDKTEPDTNTNLRLHCVVTQSNIQQNWQGQTHLNFVTRLMAPNQNGTTIDFGTGTTVSVPLTFTMNPAWPVGNCEVVLFLQNNSTKEILQGTKYSLAEIGGANPSSLTEIDFPDMYITGTSVVPLTLSNYWNITASGTIISTNPVFSITPTGRLDFTIPPYQSRTFNISFDPVAVGDQTGNIVITSNFPDYENITIPVSGYGFYNTAPSVSDVTISGVPVVTIIQTASYTFNDADMDAEGNSIYQWYRITPGVTDPIPITDATGLTYRIQSVDIGSQIAFKVTPLDIHNMPGTPVVSIPTPIIEPLPAPQNLTAQILNTNYDIQLNWEPPAPFNRDFLGYRIFRNNLIINTINNPNVTTFTDTYVYPSTYSYWVTSVFSNPISQSEPSNVVTINLTSNEDNVVPVLETVNIYPNPFNNVSNLEVKSAANSDVDVSIHNIKGQVVHKYYSKTDGSGNANIVLTKSDNMLPGIYFVSVKTSNGHTTKKVVVLK